jgi:hypothetical protein
MADQHSRKGTHRVSGLTEKSEEPEKPEKPDQTQTNIAANMEVYYTLQPKF